LLVVALAAIAAAVLPTNPTAAGRTSARTKLASPPHRRPPARRPRDTTYDWLQFNGDPQHTGINNVENIINPANVASLTPLFQVNLPQIADGTPVFLSAVPTTSGFRDMVYVTTEDGSITALDGESGELIWTKQAPSNGCQILNIAPPCFTTSSPAIDPNRQFVYSYGLDGYIHKYAVVDGTEVVDGNWPELSTLKPDVEKGSAPLVFATAQDGNTYLYSTISGYPTSPSGAGDLGDYQGHITAVNLATGEQHVFNTTCSDQQDVHFVDAPGTPDCSLIQGAVWGRRGVLYDPITNEVLFATGNALYNPSQNTWGDSVLAINPDGTGSGGFPIDSYTPINFQLLDDQDLDLGSTVPAIVPAPAGSNVTDLGLQVGKEGVLILLNLADLSGQGGPGNIGGEIATLPVPKGGEVLSAPLAWQNPADGTTWIFVVNYSGVSALQVLVDGTGTPYIQPVWQGAVAGSSPIMVNNMLFYANSNSIQALDPTTGTLLWQDNSISLIHWSSPIVANGILYIADINQELTAYALPTSSFFPTPSPTPDLIYNLYLPDVELDSSPADSSSRLRALLHPTPRRRPVVQRTPTPARPRRTPATIPTRRAGTPTPRPTPLPRR
jgi:outer membrane protein assembly factor BamB